MDARDPSLIFLSLILPCLFAMTLIAEGVWKISQHTSGWVNIILGAVVIGVSVGIYFVLANMVHSL